MFYPKVGKSKTRSLTVKYGLLLPTCKTKFYEVFDLEGIQLIVLGFIT